MINELVPVSIVLAERTEVAIAISIMFDDLATLAKFSYSTKDANGSEVRKGVIGISGDEYADWDSTNEQAKQIVCNKLGLELKPPTAPEEPQEPVAETPESTPTIEGSTEIPTA